jgi:hypothetical protein
MPSMTAKTAAMINMLSVVNVITFNSDSKYTAPKGKRISVPNCWAVRTSFDLEETRTLYPTLRMQASGASRNRMMAKSQLGK